MAGTTTTSRRIKSLPLNAPGADGDIVQEGTDLHQLFLEHNRAVDDLETIRSALSAGGVVATIELMDDHATFRTWAIESEADTDNLSDQVDALLTPDGVRGGTYVLGPTGAAPTLAMSGYVTYQIGGVVYTAAVPATVTLPAQTISQSNYGAWRVEIDRLGVVTATSGAVAAGYASAQIALLALSAVAPTASAATIGYFTAVDTDSTYVVGSNNLNATGMSVVFYYEWAPRKRISGLNTAQGAVSTLTAASTTYGFGNTNVNINGLRVAQIAAGAAQALTDADTIATVTFGNVLLLTNLAGTGLVSLNATGVPGVAAMSYATAAAALTASDLVVDRLPAMFVPVALIKVSNGSGSTFTFKSTNWNATSVTSTITDAAVAGWNRTVSVGFNSHQISRVAIPANITAPVPATLTSPAPSGTAVNEAGDLLAAKIGDSGGVAITA
jgi:hypothetical protein